MRSASDQLGLAIAIAQPPGVMLNVIRPPSRVNSVASSEKFAGSSLTLMFSSDTFHGRKAANAALTAESSNSSRLNIGSRKTRRYAKTGSCTCVAILSPIGVHHRFSPVHFQHDKSASRGNDSHVSPPRVGNAMQSAFARRVLCLYCYMHFIIEAAEKTVNETEVA